jgi:hypothetical protein
MSANFDTTGRAGLHHWTCRSVQSDCSEKLAGPPPPDASGASKTSQVAYWTWPDTQQPASGAARCNVRSTRHWSTSVHAAIVRVPVRPVTSTVQRLVDAAPLLHTPITDQTHPLRPVPSSPTSGACKSAPFTFNSSNFVYGFDSFRS